MKKLKFSDEKYQFPEKISSKLLNTLVRKHKNLQSHSFTDYQSLLILHDYMARAVKEKCYYAFL